MDRSGFDPRYSPEYQRGFDPAASKTAPVEAPAGVPDGLAQVPPPAVRRIPPAPTAGSTSPDAGATLAELGIDEPAVAPASEAPELPVSPWRNPYLIALAVAGLALVLGGIGAFRWAVSQVYGDGAFTEGASEEERQETMLASQLAWGLSPLMTLAGVLTLVGLLFFVAHRWRPRPGSSAEEFEGDPDGNQTG